MDYKYSEVSILSPLWGWGSRNQSSKVGSGLVDRREEEERKIQIPADVISLGCLHISSLDSNKEESSRIMVTSTAGSAFVCRINEENWRGK